MNREEMQNIMKEYVADCSKIYMGGEKYFNEIDAKIKENKDLLLSYIRTAVEETGCTNVILSGGMFDAVRNIGSHNKVDWTLYKVSGGLRNYKYIFKCPAEFAFMYQDKEFIFVDDSFYSGKTLNQVKTFIESARGKVVATYVFYDGSKEKRKDVHSLYRYYDNFSKKEGKVIATEETFKAETQTIGPTNAITIPEEAMKLLNVEPGDDVKLEIFESDSKGKCLLISKTVNKIKMVEDLDLINTVFSRVIGKNLSVDQVNDICDLLSDFMECLAEIEGESR